MKLLKITLPYFVSVQYKEPDIHQCLLLWFKVSGEVVRSVSVVVL